MAVRPAWEVRENEGATRWFEFRLAFADGARVDALAVVGGGCVCVEEVRAQPPLSLDDLAVLADWIEESVAEACGTGPGSDGSGIFCLPFLRSAPDLVSLMSCGMSISTPPTAST
ncbi:DUF6214 family protein, partial [Streptomyces massasporeus]|uniref:DUF6214 family protein n=1 Tax=Streptomyces massasporeus TaxID=67324 RepID=UPI0033267405